MSYLIDTDTCSAHLKQHRAVSAKFLQYTGRLHVSAVTVGELHAWALRAKAPPQRLQALRDLLDDVTVLDVTEEIGRKFGEVRAALLDVGRPAPNLDLLIASTALVHNLTLITHNVSDFVNISALAVVDWMAP